MCEDQLGPSGCDQVNAAESKLKLTLVMLDMPRADNHRQWEGLVHIESVSAAHHST